MPEMTKLEKRFVNRRSSRAYVKMLDRMERAGALSLTSTSQVLELGAGNGALSALVLERWHPARVVVTDYDPDQVRVARANLTSLLGSIPSSLVLEQGDATHLGYADGTFDLVLAHHVLHHLGPVGAIQRGLHEIARTLRPGGRLLYVEMFHKRPIREHLSALGFSIAFRARALRIFTTADIVVAIRPSGPVPK